MSWANLQQASFRGVPFDCITVNDTESRAVAQHAYPYRDGADVEDLGNGPRTIRLRAIFYSEDEGDDYKVRMDAFLAAVRASGTGELVHPVFGSLPAAQVTEIEVGHEADNVDQASISVTLVESNTSTNTFTGATATQDAAAIETAADDVNDAATNVLTEQIGSITGLTNMPGFGSLALPEMKFGDLDFAAMTGNLDITRIADVRSILDGAPTLLKGLPGLPALTLLNFDSALNPRSWAGDLTALTGGLLDSKLNIAQLLPFDLSAISLPSLGSLGLPQFNLPMLPTLNLPGDLTGLRGVARQVAGFGGSISGIAGSITGAQYQITSLGGLPDAAQRVMSGFRSLSAIFSPPVRVNPYAAAAPATSTRLPLTFTTAARQSPADVQVVAVHVQTEFATTMAVAARRVLDVEAKLPLFTPAEIAEVANAARTTLETAIVAWRTNYPAHVCLPVIERLRNTALLVQSSAQSLIVRRPPLMTRTIIVPANTRLLAHLFYGDHRRAPELARMNNYGRKPVLDAGDKVQAYAQ